MEITRETSFRQAVDTAITLLEQLRDGRIAVGDHQLQDDDLVTFEVEIESAPGELEVEIELKWRAPKPSAMLPTPPTGGTASSHDIGGSHDIASN